MIVFFGRSLQSSRTLPHVQRQLSFIFWELALWGIWTNWSFVESIINWFWLGIRKGKFLKEGLVKLLLDKSADIFDFSEYKTIHLPEPFFLLDQLFTHFFPYLLQNPTVLALQSWSSVKLQHSEQSNYNTFSMFLIIFCCKYFLTAPVLPTKTNIILIPRFDRTAVVPHLHCEDQRMSEQFVHLYPCASIFGQQFVGVSTVHLIAGKITPIVAETFAVNRK